MSHGGQRRHGVQFHHMWVTTNIDTFKNSYHVSRVRCASIHAKKMHDLTHFLEFPRDMCTSFYLFTHLATNSQTTYLHMVQNQVKQTDNACIKNKIQKNGYASCREVAASLLPYKSIRAFLDERLAAFMAGQRPSSMFLQCIYVRKH